MTVSAITVIPALAQKLVNQKRKLDWLALVSSVSLQGIVKGYSISNLKWIIAQAALESDWGNSNLATTHNSYWGMWQPRQREYFAEGIHSTNDGVANVVYLTYRSPWQCARDRFAWDAEFNESVLPFKASPLYGEAVGSRFHGSSAYASAVRNVMESNIKELTTGVWVSLTVAPLELYLATKIFT